MELSLDKRDVTLVLNRPANEGKGSERLAPPGPNFSQGLKIE